MSQPLGIVDCSNDEYHASEGISRTKLWNFKKLPYKFWYQYLSGEYEAPKESKPFLLGSLVHTLALEPELFDKEYCLMPTLESMPAAVLLKDVGREQYEQIKTARTEIQERNKALMDEFKNNLQTKTVVEESTLVHAHGMSEAIWGTSVFKEIMNGALVEKSIYWRHKATGMICKARPDIWKGSLVGDLKTVSDASPRGFQSAAYKHGYFLQAGMIYEGLRIIGKPFEKFVFACVENTKPYATAFYVLDDEALQFGIDMYHALMERLARCYADNIWPDYGISRLMAPSYATIDEGFEHE